MFILNFSKVYLVPVSFHFYIKNSRLLLIKSPRCCVLLPYNRNFPALIFLKNRLVLFIETQHQIDFTGLLLVLVLLLYSHTATAQATNDDFANRLSLRAEIPVNSSTVGCTVQPNCIDEKLTGKCVEYHNDQWFEFKPESSGNYFLNISNQHCRDVRGVQLVVFTGQPCQPATYHVLSCTSLGSLDDVYVPLWNAKAGQTYYLNVDGYLHDFCAFRLEVSTEAQGLPATSTPLIPAPSFQKWVSISWQLPDSVLAQSFKVWRRRTDESRSTLIKEVNVIRNAYGKPLEHYQLTDTLLTAGTYFYQIVAEGPAVPVLLKQMASQYKELQQPKFVLLPLNEFPEKAKLTVIATDLATGNTLRRAEIITHRKQQSQAYFLLPNPDLETGKKIQVTILHHKRNRAVSRNFLLSLQTSHPE